MATKTFGKLPQTTQEVIDELYSIVGLHFPIYVQSVGGQVVHVTYETTWNEGGTTPVEKTDKETGHVTIDYEENYTAKKLSAEQIKNIDNWLADNLTS